MAVKEIQNIRQKYPQYSDLNDMDIAVGLSKKYPQYSDLVDMVKQDQSSLTENPNTNIQKQEPMFKQEDYTISDIYAPQKKENPLMQAIDVAKRGALSGLGSFIPGGEITVRKPELAGRVASAVVAPVGTVTGLVGEYLGKEIAPKGKENIGRTIGGVAGGLLGEGAFYGLKKIASGSAGKIINSMIKPSKVAYKYGKNPGKTVSELGITGNSLEQLGSNIEKTISTKLDDLKSLLNRPENIGKKINYKNAIDILDSEISQLSKAKQTNSGVISKVEALRDDLISMTREASGKFKNTLTSLSPEEAVEMKRVVGGLAKWTGTDTPPEFNGLIHRIYHSMKSSIERVIPESAKINKDIANLIGASKAIPGAITRGSNHMLPISARSVFSGIGGGLITGNPYGAIGAMAIEKALSSPATGTRIAKNLAKFAGNKGRLLTGLVGK